MEFRLIQPEEAEKFRTLRLTALKECPECFASSYDEEKTISLARFKEQLTTINSYVYGAFRNEELVGTLTLVEETKQKLNHRATIFAMYISCDYRKNGIGKKLLQEAIKKANELQLEQVYLTVVSSNEPAKNLYYSQGFKSFGYEKRALKVDGVYYDEEHLVHFLI
ncbi:GNAT family N-acetyltransferase [Bacillus weihaiensis]|uniref:GNAT family N-acetyltransferase n=1 Tax=Bacillus weihaiensis TaxID=1547283 RepID=UPI0023533D52|nr:GNAT family N-acetyltransferase [Bacillus weihaiensis]